MTVPPPLPPQPPGPHLPWGWEQCHGLTPLGAASTRRMPSCRGCLAGCGGDGPGKGVAGSGTSRTATAAEQCGLADLQRSVPGILGSSRQPFKHITSDQRRGQGRASVTTPASRCKYRASPPSSAFPRSVGKEGGVEFPRLPRCQNPSLTNSPLLGQGRWPGCCEPRPVPCVPGPWGLRGARPGQHPLWPTRVPPTGGTGRCRMGTRGGQPRDSTGSALQTSEAAPASPRLPQLAPPAS